MPIHKVLPTIENSYQKNPEKVFENFRGKFIQIVKSMVCYKTTEIGEACRWIMAKMDMPPTNTSVDFIKIPKVFTFYIEYQSYFDNINMDPKVSLPRSQRFK